jgi:hypothetical protein
MSKEKIKKNSYNKMRYINQVPKQQHNYGLYNNGNIQQNGDGIISDAMDMYQKFRGFQNTVSDTAGQVLNTAKNTYASSLGNKLRNMLPNADENGRPGFPGELHPFIRCNNGKWCQPNFIGPGTALKQRLERGDPPRTDIDQGAMAHDIRYTLAENMDDIRHADKKLLDVVEKSKNDAPYNKHLVGKAIKSKAWLEKYKLMDPSLFAGDVRASYAQRGLSDEDVVRMESKLATLEQEGYGKKKSLPVDRLKLQIIKKLSKEKKKNKKKKLQEILMKANQKDIAKLLPNILHCLKK